MAGVVKRNWMIDFLLSSNEELMTAMECIDRNHKGFLVIVDSSGCLYGVLTDGDIRRYILKEKTTFGLVGEICKRTPYYLKTNDTLGNAIELFKNEGVDFLPILAEDNTVVNLITKRQLDVLLLQDTSVSLDYDFMSLDDSILEHEIYHRPWGLFKTTMLNEYFQSKMIVVYPMGKLSLQYHIHREEYWVIVHGIGVVELGDSIIDVKSGSVIFIPKGVKHRVSNLSNTESLVFSEVQIGDYFGEDDIFRIEDNYGRES